MKFLSTILLVFMMSGCASYHTRQEPDAQGTSAVKKSAKKTFQRNKVKAQDVAVWDLLNRESLTLYFSSVDNGSNLTIILKNGLNQKEVPKGHWELTGFSVNGKSFTSMNTSKKFVFRMKSSHTYAGSLVVGCPTVKSQDTKFLKSMKFFNRYPFTSKSGLCEIVIGNDFAEVRNAFRKSRKNKNLGLETGF